ncbi:hypothetical protein T440DRAFT_523763 [Plenodomus tracheiphilus IPT5]|uniref:Uncharacterized protein n=1 Tax=Plenodomus tracheiphilus IPT5 TaxID=1408161 RepID=A0A6A7AM73_9PLEO|nr:hypothetical protein T440DRAFT_523763 [Plenodomus tracheiphilus IPT5]
MALFRALETHSDGNCRGHDLLPGQCMGLLADFVTMIVINGSGGAIYATHFLDERIKKKLGVPGASHQVMHVLAVVGALIYERGLMLAYSQHHRLGESCPL